MILTQTGSLRCWVLEKKRIHELLTFKVDWEHFRFGKFSIVSKIIRDCNGFALLRSTIGLENSRHSFNQSHTELKAILTWFPAFFCANLVARVFPRGLGCPRFPTRTWLPAFSRADLVARAFPRWLDCPRFPALTWLHATSRAFGSWVDFTLSCP